MKNERFGYFRFEKRGKVHYLDGIAGKSEPRTLCGRYAVKRRLIPAGTEDAETDLCKTCKKVVETEFYGWEQML